MQQERRDDRRWLITTQDDGPPVGGVTFRVGLRDEPANYLGIHQLAVWLLRLATNIPTESEFQVVTGGFGSGVLRTTFMFWGDEHGVAKRMDDLIEAIVNPPTHLLQDALARSQVEGPFLNQQLALLLADRFGPTDVGLIALRSFYLDRADADEVVSYIRTHFNTESAMFWSNSEPVAAYVTKSLPSGQLNKLSDVTIRSSPSTRLTQMEERVTLTMMVDSSPAGRVAAEIIGSRINRRVSELQALASMVSFTMTAVDAHHAMAVVDTFAGAGQEAAVVDAMCQTLDDIRADGPLSHEIETELALVLDNLREQGVGESLELASGEILASNTTRWLDAYVGITGDISADVIKNVQQACRTAQVVADRKLAGHTFMYPVVKAEKIAPKGLARRYFDVLDRHYWFRLDGSVLSRMKRSGPFSFRAQVEWQTDLAEVRTIIQWTNETTSLLDALGDNTSMFWPRISRGEALRRRVESHLRSVDRIDAKADEDLVTFKSKIRRVKRAWAVSVGFRALLIGILVAGGLASLFDSNPDKTNQPTLFPGAVTVVARVGEKVALPNGATMQLLGYENDAVARRVIIDFQACGGDPGTTAKDLTSHSRNSVDVNGFQLVMADNTTEGVAFLDPVEPRLLGAHLASGECRRGKLPFDYLPAESAKSVYLQNSAGDSIRWSLG